MAAVTLILNRIRILESSCLLRDGFNLALKNAFKFLRVLPSFRAASKILHKKESSSLSARCLAGSDLLPINLFSINCRGYPALLYFALIALISMSKFDAIFLDLKSFLNRISLIFFRNFRHPRYNFLIFFSIYLWWFRYTCTFIVQNDFCI